MTEIFNIPLANLIGVCILFMLVLVALFIIYSRNLLICTVLMSIFSLLMAMEYLVLGAPDVAITEAAVGAGISTILLLLALNTVGSKEKKIRGHVFFPLAVVILTGAALIYATFDMPPFGLAEAPTHGYLAPYYLKETYPEIGIPNVVTAVLASYRGFDTLGEVSVVFTAALCVVLLLGNDKKRSG